MQDYITFNDVKIKQPDRDGYTVKFSTTSTADSDRTFDLVMHNTPMGTIQSYGLKWTDNTAQEVAEILRQILNKSSFRVHYFNVLTSRWENGEFYATSFEISPICLENGEERIDELSFDIIGVEPI